MRLDRARTLFLCPPSTRNHFQVPAVRCVVAIPVKDEAERLPMCPTALASQCQREETSCTFGVLLLLNNCSDGSADLAARLRLALPFPLQISTVALPLPFANAGYARRLAMDLAADWLAVGTGEDSAENQFLLTTDADSCAATDWIARHVRHFRRGIDVVAGLVCDDPHEETQLPPALRERGRWEERYTGLLTELETLLDPIPWDPWPRHAMASGASLGLRLFWYQRIGGLPVQSSGEDRALIDCFAAAGARIRHCRKTMVTTSCRLDGRAAGGMADAMRIRIAEPESFCDEGQPPVWAAIRQFMRQAAIRRMGSSSVPPPPQRLRLRPSELPRETKRAEQVLLSLRLGPRMAGATARRAGTRAGAAHAPA